MYKKNEYNPGCQYQRNQYVTEFNFFVVWVNILIWFIVAHKMLIKDIPSDDKKMNNKWK